MGNKAKNKQKLSSAKKKLSQIICKRKLQNQAKCNANMAAEALPKDQLHATAVSTEISILPEITDDFAEVSLEPPMMTVAKIETGEEVPPPSEDVECRACLQRFDYDAGLLDMFQAWEPPWNGMGESIAQDFSKLANVEITTTDSFPKMICQFCHQKLLEACSFVVNVRINDRLLRQRAETFHDPDNTWPKPIQVDRNINSDVLNTAMDVEIKQEVLSEDENYPACSEDPYKDGAEVSPSVDSAFNNLDIKVEPEEIMQTAPYQIMVNGTITNDQYEQNSVLVNGDHKPAEPEKSFKRIINKRRKLAEFRCKLKSTLEKIDNKKKLLHFDSIDSHKDDGLKVDSLNNGHTKFSPYKNMVLKKRLIQLTKSPSVESPQKKSDFGIKEARPVSPKTVESKDLLNEQIKCSGPVVGDMHKVINLPNESNSENNTDKYQESKLKNDIIRSPLKCPPAPKVALLKGPSCTYTVDNKKSVVSIQEPKSPCSCKLKCYEKLPYEKRLEIFNQFWIKCNTWEKRYQFVINSVTRILINTNTICRNLDTVVNQKYSYIFSFIIDAKPEKVCRLMYLNTLSIGLKFVKFSFTKHLGKCAMSPDQRGKTHIYSKTPDLVNSVKEHINLYTNRILENGGRHLFETNLNISVMYKEYTELMAEKGTPPHLVATLGLYRDRFNAKFKLSPKMSPVSTCVSCDNYESKLQDAKDDKEKEIIENEKKMHIEDVQERHNLKTEDKHTAKENSVNKKVLIFDLQQAATSHLTNSKLRIFTLTIFDLTVNNVSNIMWSEDIGGCSANEIASCLIRWAKDNNNDLSTVRDLTLWSDDSLEQHLDLTLVIAYMWLLNRHAQLKVINHKFMIKGHADTDMNRIHAEIDKINRQFNNVHVSTNGSQRIRTCGGTGTFSVYDMHQHNFKDFTSLLQEGGPFVPTKKNVYGEEFSISNSVWLQVRQEQPGILFYKKSFSHEFSAISLIRDTSRRAAIPKLLPILEDAAQS